MRAVRLSSAVIAMIRAAPPAGALQAGWTINRCIIAHSLSYDSRVLPSRVVLPHAAAVDDAVLRVATEVLGVTSAQFTAKVRQQMQLPTRNAGLQLDLPSRVLPMARAASLMEIGTAVRHAVATWAVPGVEPERYDGVDLAVE